ncbi:PH domain-containing protein [Thiorhodococcus mannitoliphagus]|uniref:PH domain-containing protein n=1 Tax=Thiorhodococcus mannitoliphagus TaxID=329406 RepID=A0A6P1DTC8_9GAMM|nr:PH domain-containing protein [Thiorhodococcus mannitoliphagus]NEX21577.1 PH domain-containing protein [Thiorhodococcus mannitoliphagus]
MSNVVYEAHPSVLRMRPFGVLLALVLMAGGILVAVLGAQLVPPAFAAQLDGKILQLVGIGVFALSTLQLLTWWVSARSDRLVITDDELIWTHGLLSKQYTEINMASVRTVRVSQSLFQRIMNAGDVTVFTAGDNPELFVRGLPDPGEVRELVKANPQAGS